jgi:fucose 4-O-acetylase-like acetyltransferase
LKKNYYYSVDLFKVIFAVFVVLIHVTAPIYQNGIATFENYYWYRYFLNYAVPFFFVSSGIFLSSKDDEGFKKYIKKIIKYYVVFSSIYIALKLIISLFHNGTTKGLIGSFKLVKILNGSIGSFHLWFLASLVISCIIILALRSKLNYKQIVVISIVFYLCAHSGAFNIVTPIFQYGSISEGVLYISIGCYLTTIDVKRFKYPIPLLLIFSFVYFETSYLYKSQISKVFLVLAIFYLCVICVKYSDLGKGLRLLKFAKYSLAVYILHVAVQIIITDISKSWGFSGFYKSPIYYFITVLFCLIVPPIIFKPIERMTDKFINVVIEKPPFE